MGLVGSRSLECRKEQRASRMRPSEPLAASDHARCTPGRKGKFRRHTHKAPEAFGLIADAARGPEVDAEGFLRKQILPRPQHIEINLLVQVMRGGPPHKPHQYHPVRAARGDR